MANAVPAGAASAGATTPSSRRGRGRRTASLAALPNPREQEQLTAEATHLAQERLAAAAAAGTPLVDRTGRQRSPITLPEYRARRAPANKGRRYPAEVLVTSEVQALLDALPRRGASGSRNRALIVVLWRVGLRIGEALALAPKDLDLELGSITVLQGKGAKRRVVAVDRMTRRYLEAWLAERSRLGIGEDTPLFCTVSRDVAGVGRSMGAPSVREMLKRYARKAGLRKRVHPHGLRHTCAFELSEAGIPMTHIQQQLGHEDLAMTDHYVRHLAPRHLFASIGERACPDEGVVPLPSTSLALSGGTPAPAGPSPSPLVGMDPPEPKPAAVALGRGLVLRAQLLEAIAANGGAATQGQLRRSLGVSRPALLAHLHALHSEGAIIRTGLDRNRSIIWKVAPPPVVLRRTAQLRCPPNGEGPLRVLDALDALDGRASQAELARLLELDPETVRGHCVTLEATGQLVRGGLDKSTSRRGSQVWTFPSAARSRYRVGLTSGYSMQLRVPR